MKKTLSVMIVTFMMVLCMTGCGKEQDEFVDYVNNSRKEVTDLEKKAKDSYASVVDDISQDGQTALDELSTNTADLAKQAVDKATALGKKLEGEELKKVHELYVTSLKDFQSGIDQFIQALENGDSDLGTQANDTMSKATEETEKYMKELKKLADDLGVELKDEDKK